MLVKCCNQNLSRELYGLSKEIIHLAKLHDLSFDDAKHDYEYNTLKTKLKDECEIFIKFEVKKKQKDLKSPFKNF